jgi:hypothetical protein
MNHRDTETQRWHSNREVSGEIPASCYRLLASNENKIPDTLCITIKTWDIPDF